MITLHHTLAGDQITIRCLEPGDDPQPVLDFVSSLPVVGFDTESTGLDLYSPTYRTRLAQFGDETTSYVLRVDCHADAIREAVRRSRVLAAHNADHDLISLAVSLGVPLEETYGKTWCTVMMSKLADPYGALKRPGKPDAKHPGKLVPQHGLKVRVRQLVDAHCDIEKELDTRFRKLKCGSKKEGAYAKIPIDDEVYLRYAGLDPILAVRLMGAVRPLLTPDTLRLLEYERMIAYTLVTMRHRGLLVDEAYTREQIAQLDVSIEETYARAASLGVPVRGIATDVDKAAFVEFLAGHGLKPPMTDKGKPSLAKDGILPLVGGTSAGPAVATFYEAKEQEKNRKDYFQKFLDGRDAEGRLHPSINGMGALTGRMSVSDPPLQQIPRHGDVRGCLTADEGCVLISADLAQIEFRVAAAIIGEANLIEVIKRGVDIHSVVPRRLFGPDFTDEHRTITKPAGLGRLYGSGVATAAQQAGVAPELMAKAFRMFDSTFPGIKQYARKVGTQDEIVTPFNRVIPIDPQRPWAAINYSIQPPARDLFAYSMLRMVDAGLGEHLWLPYHDEIIANVPEQDAPDVCRIIEEGLRWDLNGVPVVAEAKILGKRWAKG